VSEGWLTVRGIKDVRHYFVEGDGCTVSLCSRWSGELEKHYSARNRGGPYVRRCPECNRLFAAKFYKPRQSVGAAATRPAPTEE